MDDTRLGLFIMLGQEAERQVLEHPSVVPPESLLISHSYDLATVLPGQVRRASSAALVYKLFFVFENFLRELVFDVLSEKDKVNWWGKVPKHIQDDVEYLEKNEETKAWMSLGSRDKLSLTTYSQLLAIIDEGWKSGFEAVIRDKSLVQSARHVAHLRNAICHMTEIPPEETERIRQVIRDWFRMVSP